MLEDSSETCRHVGADTGDSSTGGSLGQFQLQINQLVYVTQYETLAFGL